MRAVALWLGVLTLFLASCQTRPTHIAGLEPTPEQRASYRSRLDGAWNILSQGDAGEAFAAFQRFRRESPNTIFETEARFGEARSLGVLNEWDLSMKIYRQIIVDRLSSNPELAALAMFYQAEAAEALGNESQMLASLRDAETHANLLPDEIRLAALPARLAVAQLKMGQTEEAQKNLKLAESGINQLRARGFPSGEWARLYFEMGSVATNQLAPENFQSHLDSFSSGQIFLLKAIEVGVSPWSDRALMAMQEHYRDFWNMALNPPVSQALDVGARDRTRSELQSRWLGEVLKLVTVLQQHRKPEELKPSEQEARLNGFLKKIEERTERHFLEAGSVLPLTPEAKRRGNLKKVNKQ